MYTWQESFEISSLALIAQGHPGADKDGFCSYVHGCAAAHLVPLEVRDHLSGLASNMSNRQYFLDAGHEPNFVQELQDIHDESMMTNRTDSDEGGYVLDVDGWRRTWLTALCDFAPRRGLDPSRVLEAAKAAGWEVLA